MTVTTDFGYEMEIDNDGEIQLIERGNQREIISALYISKSDIDEMVQLIREWENGR